MFKSIYLRFIALILILWFVGVFLLIFITKFSLSDAIEEQIQNFMKEHIEREHTQKIDNFFQNTIDISIEFANRPIIKDFLQNESEKPKVISSILKDELKYIKKENNLSIVYITSDLTKDFYTQDGFLLKFDTNSTKANWYNKVINSGRDYMLTMDDTTLDRLHLWVDVVIKDMNKTLGVAGVGVDRSKVHSIMKDINITKESRALLVDKNFIIKSASNEKLVNKNLSKVCSSIYGLSNKLISENKNFILFEDKGEEKYLFVNKIESIDWYLIIDIPKKFLLNHFDNIFLITNILEFLFLLIVITLITYFLNRNIIKPLDKFSLVLQDFSPENGIDKNIFLGYGSEFERIGEAFLKSSNLLKKSYFELQKSREALKNFNVRLERKVEQKTKMLKSGNLILKDKIEELKISQDNLQKALQTKSVFISNISHELRTPLNSVINFTNHILEDFDKILKEKERQEEAKRFLNRVLRNSEHLLSLINDILDFSKIEAGELSYNLEKVNLKSVLITAYNNSEILLKNPKVKFNLVIEREDLVVFIDRRRFLQILLNIISNAIKFTKEGFIEIRLKEQSRYSIVEIEDSGRGIPNDKKDLIFKPFKQVDSFDKGSGLGLAITKKMCENMKIDLTFNSKVGKGSIFILKLKNIERINGAK